MSKLSAAQLEVRRLGGLAVRSKTPPDVCPDCGRQIAEAGYTWHQWLGHRGLHGLADRYFDGDVEDCQRRLRRNGIARGDPAPWNNAMPRYIPVQEAEDGVT